MPKNFFFIQLGFMLLLGLTAGKLPAQQTSLIISGKVLDKSSNAPIEFVTVALMNPDTNSPIAGTTSGTDGNFTLRTEERHFFVELSFIGLKTVEIRDFQITSNQLNLGNIYMSDDSKQLDEIVIEGEKSQTEFRLDKRVFNVGADLSSQGASALEVLANVPSVNVNIQGQVSLRGSTGVQILIDGKPSVLTSSDNGNALGTITADMIERVEVITNPSAKYEAEGTAGIINIVLKKEDKRGTNGSISLNTGTPASHSVGLSLNQRTEKFNLFSQFGVGYRKQPIKSKVINDNYATETTIFSNGTEYRNELFYNVILGSDYHINDYNVITLSGNYAMEVEDQPSETKYLMEQGEIPVSTWLREENTTALNPKYQFELMYKRDFEDHKDHDLIFSAIGSSFAKDQSSDFTNTTVTGEIDQDLNQKTATDFQEGKYTFKLDYTRPWTKEFTLETGAQYLINDVGNDYEVQNLIDNIWTIDSTQTNNFEYNQKVLGAYGTGAYENKTWGLKLGLRVEQTDLDTYLTNTKERNSQNYTNLFPSVHSSYKLVENLSVQAGYSRRIYRPRLWDLNPFFNIRNNYSIRQGNPDLQPEFTDSYEIGTVYNASNLSLNLSVYHRYTTDVVERIAFFENNVSTTKPMNIGTNNATGVEFNTKYDPAKWLTTSIDFNYNYFDRNGELEGTVIDFSADQWTTKFNSKFKLPADFDFEMTIQYQSKYRTIQSDVSDILFVDMGAKKKIMKGKGVINASVRDLFASRIEESIVSQTDYSIYNRGFRGRYFTLGFSFGFGKGEAMTYSGAKHH